MTVLNTKLCSSICERAFIVVKVPLACSVKLQFDLHLHPVISATSTVLACPVGSLILLNVILSTCCRTVCCRNPDIIF